MPHTIPTIIIRLAIILTYKTQVWNTISLPFNFYFSNCSFKLSHLSATHLTKRISHWVALRMHILAYQFAGKWCIIKPNSKQMKELQELPMLLRNRKRSFSCSVLQHKSRECSIFQNNVSLENQMPKESHILQIALLKKKIKKKRGKEQAMVKAPSFKALCQFPRNIKDQCIH